MPFGFLNENHEPTNFYGVQRNFVETLIIPSTWREGGFNLHGTHAGRLQPGTPGVTTGMNLSAWDFAPEIPAVQQRAGDDEQRRSVRWQASHQELALANARYLSQYLALGYYGVPGMTLGAAISTGKAVPVPPAPARRPLPPADNAVGGPRALDAGQVGPVGALRARAHQQPSDVNAANPGSPNPIPSNFYGYYRRRLQAVGARRVQLQPVRPLRVLHLGSSWSTAPRGPMIPSGQRAAAPTPATGPGRWITTASGRRARTSTSGRTWCSRPTTSGST